MSKDPRQAGFPWVSPYISVRSVADTIGFYQKVFGFELQDKVADDSGKLMHAEFRHHDSVIMIGLEGACNKPIQCPKTSGVASPMSLYVYVDDVDSFFEKAVKAGATADMAPNDAFWGDRICSLIDCDGYSWCFASSKK